MRIAALSTFHETCGIATYSEALYDAVERAGVGVDVLSPELGTADRDRGAPPPRLWRRGHASFVEATRVLAELHRLRPDVVHVQHNLGLYSPRFLLALVVGLRARRVPVVATLHGRTGGSRGRRFELARTLAALRGSTLVVHNESHARELGRSADVIAHGIATPTTLDVHEAKRALGIPPGRPVIAHFGFLHPDKGISAVLRAVAELRRGGAIDAHYLIVGGAFPDGPSRTHVSDLRDEIARLGLVDRVTLGGEFVPQTELDAQLAAADLLVLNYVTGSAQGTSGAVRTALAAGRPVAVSAAPVFDDVRAATHVLARPLAEELAVLLGDPALRQALAERARAWCEPRTWPSVARAHVDLYRRLAPGAA